MYMLPKVKARLSLSVMKYRPARFQILSNGCSCSRYRKKLGLAIARILEKFFLSTCATLTS
jgi:hypothetical protein